MFTNNLYANMTPPLHLTGEAKQATLFTQQRSHMYSGTTAQVWLLVSSPDGLGKAHVPPPQSHFLRIYQMRTDSKDCHLGLLQGLGGRTEITSTHTECLPMTTWPQALGAHRKTGLHPCPSSSSKLEQRVRGHLGSRDRRSPNGAWAHRDWQ